MHRMQKGELLHQKKQKDNRKEIGIEKILQVVQEAYKTQRNKEVGF